MRLRHLVYVVFVVSGLTGLTYQVIWARWLGLVFGSTSASVSIVLSSFMLGLALGSWLAGRWLPRCATPLRAYGWLELGSASQPDQWSRMIAPTSSSAGSAPGGLVPAEPCGESNGRTVVRAGTEKLLVCPICHEVDTADEFPGSTGAPRRFPVVRCVRCSLVLQKYRPTEDELEGPQRTAFGRPQRRFNAAVESAVRLARSSRVRLATRLMPPKGRVLDVGCGRGLFLSLLRARGYRVRGTELSSLTASNAIPGVPIDLGDLRVGQYPEDHFDLVSIWHVLEHLRSPDETLAACFRSLRPGGSLLVAVPNYASVQARLGGEDWFHLDLPRHLFQFSEGTLRSLLCQSGFVIDSIRTGQWEMDPFGLLQTALNRIGLRHNALYDVLRNCEEDRRDLSALYRCAMLALLPLGAVAVLVSAVLRLLGRAGTLIVIAHKPAEPV